MKNISILIVIGILTSLLFSSCEKACIEGNNNPISEYRETSDFDEVVVEGNLDVDIFPADINEIFIEAESNLLPYISTRVSGNSLIVKTKNNRCLDNNLPITIQVYAKNLREASVEGSGSIYAEDIINNEIEINISGSGNAIMGINCNYLDVDINGTGDVEVWGNAHESEMHISGSGSINAYGLYQELCFARISGSGNMWLFVTELLDVKISGSGNIYYRGNPEINSSISGSGNIFNKN